MNEELKELVSRADRGDNAAQKELMKRGDDAAAAGDHEQAAWLYKMAAMAYRIDAGRQAARASEAEWQWKWLEGVVQLYRDWIAAYARPLAPRINRLKHYRGDFDHPILSMRRDGGKHTFMLRHLERLLLDRGMDICTGSTINRHFYYMVQQREDYKDFMHTIDMRVVLDPIADEVMLRLEHQ